MSDSREAQEDPSPGRRDEEEDDDNGEAGETAGEGASGKAPERERPVPTIRSSGRQLQAGGLGQAGFARARHPRHARGTASSPGSSGPTSPAFSPPLGGPGSRPSSRPPSRLGHHRVPPLNLAAASRWPPLEGSDEGSPYGSFGSPSTPGTALLEIPNREDVEDVFQELEHFTTLDYDLPTEEEEAEEEAKFGEWPKNAVGLLETVDGESAVKKRLEGDEAATEAFENFVRGLDAFYKTVFDQRDKRRMADQALRYIKDEVIEPLHGRLTTGYGFCNAYISRFKQDARRYDDERDRRKQLEKLHEDAEKKFETMRRKLESERDQAQDEIRERENIIRTATMELDSRNELYSEAEQKLEHLEEQLRIAKEDAENLRGEIDFEREVVANTEATQAQATEEDDAFGEPFENLKEALDQAKKESDIQIAALEREIDGLRKKLAKETEKAVGLEGKLDSKDSEAKAAAKEAEHQIQALTQQVQTLAQDGATDGVEKAKRMADLKEENAYLAKKISDLEKRTQVALKESEVDSARHQAELREKIKAIEREAKMAQEASSQSENLVREEKAELAEKIKEAQQEVERLKQETEDSQHKIQTKEAELAETSGKLAQLESALVDKGTELERINKSFTDLVRRVDEGPTQPKLSWLGSWSARPRDVKLVSEKDLAPLLDFLDNVAENEQLPVRLREIVRPVLDRVSGYLVEERAITGFTSSKQQEIRERQAGYASLLTHFVELVRYHRNELGEAANLAELADETRKDRKAAEEQLRQLESKSRELEERTAEQASQESTAKKDLEVLASQLADQERRLAEERTQVEKDTDKLQKDQQDVTARQEKLAADLADVERRILVVEEREKENLAVMDSIATSRKDLAEKTKAYEADLDQNKEETETVKRELETAKDELEEKKRGQESQLQQQELDLQRRVTEFEELKQQMDQQTDQAAAELQRREDELEEARKNLDKRSEEIAKAEKDLQSELKALRAQEEQIRAEQKALEERKSELDQLEAKTGERRNDISQRISELLTLHEAIDKAKEHLQVVEEAGHAGTDLCFCTMYEWARAKLLRGEGEIPQATAPPHGREFESSLDRGRHGHGVLPLLLPKLAALPCQMLTAVVWLLMLAILQPYNYYYAVLQLILLATGYPWFALKLLFYHAKKRAYITYYSRRNQRHGAIVLNRPKSPWAKPPSAGKIVGGVLCFGFFLHLVAFLAIMKERSIWLEDNGFQRAYVRDLDGNWPYQGWSPYDVDYRLLYEPSRTRLLDLLVLS